MSIALAPSRALSKGINNTSNLAPVVITSPGNTVFVSGSARVDVDINVSDADNGTLASATIAIVQNFVPNEDYLSFNPAVETGNISATYSSVDGKLTLTSLNAQASVAQWQLALQKASYSNSLLQRTVGTRKIAININDGIDESSPAFKTLEVQAFNFPPSIAGTPTPTFFVEGNNVPSVSVVVDPLVTLSDPDANSTFRTILLHLTSPDQRDALQFANDGATMGNISGSFTTPPLVLTSAGNSATLVEWQAALRSIKFTNNSETPFAGSRFVQFVGVDDLGSPVFGPTRSIIVTAVNDDPVLQTSVGTTVFKKFLNVTAVPVVVDELVNIQDVDNPRLSKAFISISGNFNSPEDQLLFSPLQSQTGNITGIYNQSTGVLTLSSLNNQATINEWLAALRSVAYNNNSLIPNESTRTISFVINDGTTNSQPAFRNVSVQNISSANRSWYVSVSGNNTNNGRSPATAWASLQYANDYAEVLAGDTIYVLAGAYSEYVNITKSLNYFGPNYNKSPNSALRDPEAVVSGVNTPVSSGPTVFDVHTPGTSVQIKGFRLINGYPLHDGHFHRNPVQDISIDFKNNHVVNGINVFAGSLTRWKTVNITDNLFEAMNYIPYSSAIRINDFNEPFPAVQHEASVVANITDNVIKGAAFGGILVDNLLSANIRRNYITGGSHTGILAAGGMHDCSIEQNEIDNTNSDHIYDAGGIKIHGSEFTGTVRIRNNIVRNSYNGIAIYRDENLTGKKIEISGNHLDNSNTDKAIYHGGSGTITAGCNWLGSADAAIAATRVTGAVNYAPYLGNATDVSPSEPGFQPVAGSCNLPSACGPDDKVPPVLITKPVTIYLNESGLAVLTATDVISSATDNCGMNVSATSLSRTQFTCDDASASVFSPIPVLITVADISGNVTTATAAVTVRDNRAPVIVAKKAVLNLDAFGNVSVRPIDVIFSVKDNCQVEASSLRVSPANFNCSNLGTSVSAQAYTASSSQGNQPSLGEIGQEFNVNTGGIIISQLGAFDHEGNGINGTQQGGIRVAVFNKATRLIVPGLDVIISGTGDQSDYFYRLKNIVPVFLPQGQYLLVSKGYNNNELHGNAWLGGGPYPMPQTNGGSISFGNNGYWGDDIISGFNYPAYHADAGIPGIFLAGTFTFKPAAPATKMVTITASDIYGNTTKVTSEVVINDPFGVCNQVPRTLTNTSKIAPGVDQAFGNEKIAVSKTLNVHPNPSTGQFTVSLADFKSTSITITIVDEHGSMLASKTVTQFVKGGKLTCDFNLGNKASGIYYIHARGNLESRSTKLLIQH